MKSVKKVVLFGCGDGGKNTFKFLKQKYKIIAFTDNNKNLYGSKIFNIDVIEPSQLKVLDFDYIFISSMYREEINKQLINELNISSNKIKFLDIEILNGQRMNIPQIIIYNTVFLVSLIMLVYGMIEILEYFIK